LNEIFELKTDKIIINEDLPRIRQDMQKINALAESFKRFGQLQPIIINRDYELIVGGRRLAACVISGVKVKCCFNDAIDKDVMRELEIEENLQRENFTPAEEVLAIEELHRIKTARFGEAKLGRPGVEFEGEDKDKGWRVEDTAEVMGKTEGNIRAALKMAEMVRQFPELKGAKTKKDIVRAAKGLEQVVRRIDAIDKYKDMTKEIEIPVIISRADARDFMKEIPTKNVDLLLTDPIYGIDIDEVAMGLGGETGGSLTTSGFNYEDKHDEAMDLYEILANESFRFCKDDAHAWVFLGPENFWVVKEIFQKAGWLVHVKPFIWIKGMSGQGNQPSMWPTSAYEMCLFARKHESKLVIEGKVDWIQLPRINPNEKRHGAEKPLALGRELILRTTLPGMIMADPFMGSGSFVEAACDAKLAVLACDITMESYATTIERIGKWKERRDAEK
jgi:DNA modification methylase